MIKIEDIEGLLNDPSYDIAKLLSRNIFDWGRIYKNPWYNDEPKIFGYSLNYSSHDSASGFSFDKRKALVRLLGEAVERESLLSFKPKIKKTEKIEKIKEDFLNPLDFELFSKIQLRKKSFKKFRIDNSSTFRWSEAQSLIDDKEIIVPTQLILYKKNISDEPTILNPTSSGVAAGPNLEFALCKAMFEMIERDSFLAHYLNKLSSPKVDLRSFDDPRIENILRIFKRYNLEILVLDAATDLGVPSFVALTIDRTGLGPAVSVGLKSDFNIPDAIIGAIEESLMTRSWIRDKYVYSALKKMRNSNLISIEDRAYFWFDKKMLNNLEFWLKTKKIKKQSDFNSISAYKLKDLIERFRKCDMSVYYVDITDRKFDGFSVVRVIIPKLLQMYLDERYPHFGSQRIFKLSYKNNYILNRVPHPFL